MRQFDHCILPVSDLEIARTRLTALGFRVADDARHPFGTENCCVFFDDDTYLEPLAVGQREDCERTAQKGNQFTLRDQTYRFRNGDNGFSSIAMKTDSADDDHKTFVANGMSAGRKLTFGRTLVDASGKKGRATFKLAFAFDPRSPDSFGFTCERVSMPNVDRSSLQVHENGVIGIQEIVASEHNPTDFQYTLQTLCANRKAHAHSFGMSVACENCDIDVETPEGLSMRFGVERHSTERGIRFEGIVFRCADFSALQRICAESQITLRERSGMLIADKADGQGAFFAFVEV